MRVIDILGEKSVSTAEELESAITAKQLSSNSFWLSDGDNDYPLLQILIKDDLASLFYFPTEQNSCYQSIGKNTQDPNGEIWFSISKNRADDVTVSSDGIVDIPTAVRAAKEFLAVRSLPVSVDWLKLY